MVASLGGVAILAFILRGESWLQAIKAIIGYALSTIGLFMTSYLLSTWFYSDAMKWLPFVHRDFVHHQHTSVCGGPLG